MGTTDARFRQGMAGGPGWFTLTEHAGQVPDVHRPFTQEQHHHTLRHSQGIEIQETRNHR